MKLFNNSELRHTALLVAAVTLAASIAAFLWRIEFGVFTFALCLCFGAIWFFHTRYRYKRLAEFTNEINAVLHGHENVSFARFSEGELSMLQNELQKLTVRLREQNEQLIADKINLSDFIADISHQIRTPLTSINLIVSFLNEPELTQERREELTLELSALLNRIDWLISSLLKMSRLDAGTVVFKRETLLLSRLIEEACKPLLIPLELRELTLEVDAQGTFMGDPSWTGEALCNIVKNCMEHTPAGGVLSVTGRETALFSEIIVSDTGCGIDAADMPHIFERFYKGKNSGENSVGIGLALSRLIVTEQNGTLKATARNGGGSVFTIRFYKGIE